MRLLRDGEGYLRVVEQLRHYLRTHLAGATAGTRLFERAAADLPEPAASRIREIHRELLEERAAQHDLLVAFGHHENPLLNAAAAVGERLHRLVPTSRLHRRTPMADLVDLETMRDALAGKAAGWDALLAIADRDHRLDRAQLKRFAEQTAKQQETVRALHAEAALRAFPPEEMSRP